MNYKKLFKYSHKFLQKLYLKKNLKYIIIIFVLIIQIKCNKNKYQV